MIDISPKALRFARLAAEHQSALSGHPQVDVLRQEERAFELKLSSDRIGQRVKISQQTAAFCLRAVSALLEDQANFQSSDWDGNDYAFLQSVARDLDRQLVRLGENVT